MKIGIDARFFGPKSKGLGRYTQKLITYLEKIDHTNDYVIFLRKENFDEYNPQNSNFVKICADYEWYSFAEQLLFPVILYKHKCDIVHFPHFNVPIFYFKKFIVTIHDLILLRYPTKKASTHGVVVYWFKFWMYRLVISSAVWKARTIITVSNFTKKDICKQYKLACNKTIVTYESAEIDDDYNKNDTNMVLQKYGIIKPYILYVGNAYPHKNLHNFVDSFVRYINDGGNITKVILVGCEDYFYSNLRKYIDTKKDIDITILTSVNDAELKILYEKAHFFVFPSLYEGFGLPPLEAQLFKVPVLSSEHECMVEILSTKGALYCDTKNINEFAIAMKKIETDKNMRKRLITKGSDNVQKYSWKKMAKETYNIYTKNI